MPIVDCLILRDADARAGIARRTRCGPAASRFPIFGPALRILSLRPGRPSLLAQLVAGPATARPRTALKIAEILPLRVGQARRRTRWLVVVQVDVCVRRRRRTQTAARLLSGRPPRCRIVAELGLVPAHPLRT